MPKLTTKKTTAQFIKEATILHGTLYDYSKTVYSGALRDVNITCKTHGEFLQKAYVHLRGAGCPKCGQNQANKKNTSTKTEFITKANKIHNNKYNYDKVIYKNAITKVIITCPVHGDFEQAPYHHLRGSGCRKCNLKGFNFAKPAILYYLKINDGQAYKVGITNRTVNERFCIKDLSKIEVIFTQQFQTGQDAFLIEKAILESCNQYKYTDTKLLENGNTELFKIDIYTYIQSYIKKEEKHE